MKTKTKTAAKKSKSAPKKKAAPKTLSRPALYVHDSESGPQLCVKLPGSTANGVLLPKAQQTELNALHKAWAKTSPGTDFMKFPKAAKWVKTLLTSFVFSKIEKKTAKKKTTTSKSK